LRRFIHLFADVVSLMLRRNRLEAGRGTGHLRHFSHIGGLIEKMRKMRYSIARAAFLGLLSFVAFR
jgi:hypothetical protein